jgi:hypothetical protein
LPEDTALIRDKKLAEFEQLVISTSVVLFAVVSHRLMFHFLIQQNTARIFSFYVAMLPSVVFAIFWLFRARKYVTKRTKTDFSSTTIMVFRAVKNFYRELANSNTIPALIIFIASSIVFQLLFWNGTFGEQLKNNIYLDFNLHLVNLFFWLIVFIAKLRSQLVFGGLLAALFVYLQIAGSNVP